MAKRVSRKKKANSSNNYRDGKLDSSRPDSKPALIALLLVVILIGSGLYLTSMVDTEETVTSPTYGVKAELVTNDHRAEPGGETDFVILVENTGTFTDTFTISTKSNDGGFTIDIEDGFETIMLNKNVRKPLLINVKTPSSAEGLLYAYIEVVSGGDTTKSAEVRLNVNTNNNFGNLTKVGDSVDVHYAGILASNAKLFDSSMEYIWDNYIYRRDGVTNDNRHTSTLPASNIGCIEANNPSEDCEGSKGMISGFDSKMVGMYEGQTLAVRIPAKDAYGETGGSDLAGEDLIFIIEMVTIN
jgi:hypothetical protein|tara:strand:+ start:6173 stop:7072 length:900 start_codon:yes stop_codon:yes gene_type:complete